MHLASNPAREATLRERIGDLCERGGRWPQALHEYAAALALHGNGPDTAARRATLHCKLGEVQIVRSEYEEAHEHFAVAASLCASDLRPALRARILLGQARIQEALSRFEAAGQCAHEALRCLDDDGERCSAGNDGQTRDPERASLQAHLTRMLGLLEWRQGDRAAAARWFETGLGVVESDGDIRWSADFRKDLAGVLSECGEYTRANELLQQAKERYERLSDQRGLGVCLNYLGNVASGQGDNVAAHRWYMQSMEIMERIGYRRAVAALLLNLGNLAKLRGDYDGATTSIERSLDLSEQLGERRAATEALLSLAEIANERGNLALAHRHLMRAQPLTEEVGDPWLIAFGKYLQSVLALRHGDLAQAASCREQAQVLAQQLGDPWIRGLLVLQQAAEALARGQATEALELTQQVAATWALGSSELSCEVGLMTAAAECVSGNLEAARTAANRALADAWAQGTRRREGLCLLRLGEIALAEQQSERAEEILRAGLVIADAVGAGLDAAHLRIALATAVQHRDDGRSHGAGVEVATLLNQASDVFQAAGVTPGLIGRERRAYAPSTSSECTS